jgi:hypothetical protein
VDKVNSVLSSSDVKKKETSKIAKDILRHIFHFLSHTFYAHNTDLSNLSITFLSSSDTPLPSLMPSPSFSRDPAGSELDAVDQGRGEGYRTWVAHMLLQSDGVSDPPGRFEF